MKLQVVQGSRENDNVRGQWQWRDGVGVGGVGARGGAASGEWCTRAGKAVAAAVGGGQLAKGGELGDEGEREGERDEGWRKFGGRRLRRERERQGSTASQIDIDDHKLLLLLWC